ncbi:MAG: hypothetical protein CL938_16615 [Deltaproteobacteria bacterium]|nr:hypothetical protein [Deltaproteobacteria bacterium]
MEPPSRSGVVRIRVAAVLLAFPFAACSPLGGAGPPDVLLVVVDTLRADHVGSYGYSRATTPRIDAVAAEGAAFEVAYAPMGTTTPAHAALFTSKEPLGLGLVRNGLALSEEAVTLAEILGRNGYRTAAFVSSYPVSRRFGMAQGFEYFDDEFSVDSSRVRDPIWEQLRVEGGFDRDGSATVDAALDWLETEAPASPLFLWIHLFDPHGPHRRPQRFEDFFIGPGMSRREQIIARYDANVRYADEAIGKLVDYFSESRDWENTLVVIVSDHGEGLFDHGWQFHNRTTYEEEVRIPFILRWPERIDASLRIEQPARLIDVLPTVVSALDIDAGGASFEGIDLMPHVHRSVAPDLSRPIFLQRPYPAAKAGAATEVGYGFGVRRGAWKYFEAADEGRRELYDLRGDGTEQSDVSLDSPGRADAMSALIQEWRTRQKGGLAHSVLTPRDKAALEALGYGESPSR